MKSKCCKYEVNLYEAMRGADWYMCNKCNRECQVYEPTPQSRCKTCGRFLKTEYFEGDIVTICKHCYKEFKVVDNEMMDRQFDKREPGIWWDKMEKQVEKVKPKSNQQIYTEMVEWMIMNTEQQKSFEEYKRSWVAKLKSLLGLS